MSKLAFGYNQGLADDVTAAWGCRMIVDQDGYTDYLANRSDVFGTDAEKEALFAFLNGGAMKAARENASELLKSYTMKTREREEFVLYEDDAGKIVGNTNASAGYLYVAAFLKEG
jgi:hypothetical protein